MHTLLNQWKAGQYAPFYWIEGEESYFLDQLATYVAQHCIPAPFKAFDEYIVFGKDTSVDALLLATRQPPLQATRRLVLVKEAQNLKDPEKLCTGYQSLDPNIILIAICKGKSLEGKLKIKKIIAEKKGVFVSFRKLYERQLFEWIKNYLADKKISIDVPALHLLLEATGDHLTRITNELEKILLNKDQHPNITTDDIQRYVGISKDYNIFELQNALSNGNKEKILRILQYMMRNPKAIPFTMLTATLHTYYIKLLLSIDNRNVSSTALASILGIHPFFVKDFEIARNRYTATLVQQQIQILFTYHLRYLNIQGIPTEESALTQELFAQLLLTEKEETAPSFH